jgi:phage gpG-like protein
MNVAITFPDGKAHFVKLDNFATNFNGNLEKGLQMAGRLLEGQMKKRLKKGRGGGVHQELRSDSGRLKGSITVDPQSGAKKTAGGFQVKIGPNTVYAAIHEFGGNIKVTPKMRMFLGRSKGWWLKKSTEFIKMPARPYVAPTLSENMDNVARVISKNIYRPLE